MTSTDDACWRPRNLHVVFVRPVRNAVECLFVFVIIARCSERTSYSKSSDPLHFRPGSDKVGICHQDLGSEEVDYREHLNLIT